MPLPKIEHPTFDLTLPASKQIIKLRPFLVKEEKILLMAIQSDENTEMVSAIKQVINNCIMEGNVDVETLPTIDIEYMFIKLRARSVNNIIKLTYRDLEDDKKYNVEVNLDEVEVRHNPEHTTKLIINKKLTIEMRYPRVSITNELASINTSTDFFFNVLKSCIDKINYDKNSYLVSESTVEELDEFLNSLDVGAFEKLQKFFTTMPKLHYEVKYTNSLGNERVIILSSLTDFFTLG